MTKGFLMNIFLKLENLCRGLTLMYFHKVLKQLIKKNSKFCGCQRRWSDRVKSVRVEFA